MARVSEEASLILQTLRFITGPIMASIPSTGASRREVVYANDTSSDCVKKERSKPHATLKTVEWVMPAFSQKRCRRLKSLNWIREVLMDVLLAKLLPLGFKGMWQGRASAK